MKKITFFDSMLREGAQSEGISFSVQDKIKIAKILDEIGISYIEAGNPGSNPKDMEFFEEVKDIQFKNAKLTAFGSTRRKNIKTADDKNIQALESAQTPAVAIFGKSWDFHVEEIINTTLEENLKMISDSIQYFKEAGKEVIFDAEHFFDGYKANSTYAIQTLKAALNSGADCLVLCDTNGGSMPGEVFQVTKEISETFKNVAIGIHCHNDSGVAIANTLMAVEAGASHVQGTFIGLGERTGNANLSVVIPNLQIKLGYDCMSSQKIKEMTPTALKIADIANYKLDNHMPYVGYSAFAHKGGMHVDGISKNPISFEHVNPEIIGNERRFLLSEVSGRGSVLEKIRKVSPSIKKDSIETKKIIEKLKALEHQGYQYEAAEDSFELVIRSELGESNELFEIEDFKIIEEKHSVDIISAYAMMKIRVGGETVITAAEGDGPVNALDKALREGLSKFFPQLKEVHLIDYKVRVLDSKKATASKVRVLVESTDGNKTWTTIGVSTDVVQASFFALIDSIKLKLLC